MELRRAAGDLVIRASTPIALSFNPSICPQARLRLQSLQALDKPSARPSKYARSFSTTRTATQQGAAVARKEEDEESNAPQPAPRQAFPPAPSQSRQSRAPYNPRNVVPGINDRLDFLKRPQLQQQPQQQKPSSPDVPQSSSLDELLATFKLRRPSPGSSDSSVPRTSQTNNRADASRMLRPSRYADEAHDALNLTRRVEPDVAPAPFRLGPSLGRTVEVNPKRNIDVASAFRQVEMLCAGNRVRADLNKQKFHERPGLRRKRLESERWRRRFKETFRATVRRVDELRRKGW